MTDLVHFLNFAVWKVLRCKGLWSMYSAMVQERKVTFADNPSVKLF